MVCVVCSLKHWKVVHNIVREPNSSYYNYEQNNLIIIPVINFIC